MRRQVRHQQVEAGLLRVPQHRMVLSTRGTPAQPGDGRATGCMGSPSATGSIGSPSYPYTMTRGEPPSDSSSSAP
uniref:Uncharacterized protein n=1 Tax=Tanacetum cinerariifolium TaxID=118510 RepID=A0A699V4T7_TANCI|nr:hypothetical protein [Tanacetum cinerariifolium]